ncbi:MAG: efflux RND transporter periplasmic adaptor subunit [Candidatus Aminicenantes bacterium]|nr:efflux RND transporter periplasmic adaptor subunit [Candidatus Aminicenantes bacterium]
MKKVINALALVIVAAALIFGGYKLFFQKAKEEQTETITAEKNNSRNSGARESLIPVKVIKSERGDLPLRKSISGVADVWEKVDIKAEVPGNVETLNCQIGQTLRKGQVLLKLDDYQQKLQVERNRANKLKTLSNYLVKETTEVYVNPELTPGQRKELEAAKTRFKKAVSDFDKGKISKKEFEKISGEYDQTLILSGESREEVLKARENLTQDIVALKEAELNLQRTSIRSPFPGVVTDIYVSKGEKVTAGQQVVRVVNLDTLYLKGFALESEIRNLRMGIKVRVKFDAYPEEYQYGEIRMISREVDAERKIIPIYVKLDNRDNKFYPGMRAELDIEYRVQKNVIKVPLDAIQPRQNRYLVFIVKDLQGTTGTAMWEYVELGEKNDEEQEIISGVREGDLVIIEGHMTLAHQSRVKIIK